MVHIGGGEKTSAKDSSEKLAGSFTSLNLCEAV
jgi:hypothetical protein